MTLTGSSNTLLQGHPGHDCSAASGCTVDAQFTTEEQHALLHTREAEAGPLATERWVKTATVILHS
jgi:hypothetical protein